MGIEVVKRIDFSKTLEQFGSGLEKEFSIAIKDEVVVMEKRIAQGRDINNQTFKPYSDSYEKYKRKKRGGPLIPDLTWTGNMLSAITSRIIHPGEKLIGEIYFLSAKEATKAKRNIELGRKFFGFSNEQLIRIQKRLVAFIKLKGQGK